MTGRAPLSDADLGARIRRSMQHYRLDRPLAGSGRGEPAATAWLRRALSAAAVVVALAVIVGLLTVLVPGRAPQPGSGSGIPGAVDACRTQRSPYYIPRAWLEQGETEAEIRERLRRLPLAAQDQRGQVAVLLLTDGQFTRTCVVALSVDLGPFVEEVMTVAISSMQEGPVHYAWGDTTGPIVEGGVAGSDVARIEVIRADGVRVHAILAQGVWVAWWREAVSGVAIEAFDAQDRLLGEEHGGIEVPPPPSHMPEAYATEACLGGIEEVPEPWRLPGEDLPDSLARVRNLPLLITDHGQWASTFLFGDETFWAVCIFDNRSPDSGHSGSIGPREESEAVAQPLSDWSSGPLDPPYSVIAGSATREVARLQVVLANGTSVEAQVKAGYWLASWKEESHAVKGRAFDAAGVLLGEVSLPGS